MIRLTEANKHELRTVISLRNEKNKMKLDSILDVMEHSSPSVNFTSALTWLLKQAVTSDELQDIREVIQKVHIMGYYTELDRDDLMQKYDMKSEMLNSGLLPDLTPENTYEARPTAEADLNISERATKTSEEVKEIEEGMISKIKGLFRRKGKDE